MNKRFWLAFVAVYVVGHLIGGLVHGAWLDPTYTQLAMVFRPKPEMDQMVWLLFASSALAVFAFCYVFKMGYEGKGVMEGVRYGLWIALLIAVPGAMMQLWTYPLPADLAIKWTVAGIAQYVIQGAVVAAIYRPGPPKAA